MVLGQFLPSFGKQKLIKIPGSPVKHAVCDFNGTLVVSNLNLFCCFCSLTGEPELRVSILVLLFNILVNVG